MSSYSQRAPIVLNQKPVDFVRRSLATAMSSSSGGQQQVPRRSQRVAVDLGQSDGDTWRERIAVCESATLDGRPKLLLRSYYRNSRTGARVWDEPPSGASQILHATPEMRRKAESHMQELQLTLEMIPEDTHASTDTARCEKKKKKNKLGLFRRFRGKKEKKELDESKDLNLQKAIARSMAHQFGAGGSDEPVIYYDPESNNVDEEEELALAKTMSLSESMSQSMTEEEMLQQALAASRKETHASLPPSEQQRTSAVAAESCQESEEMDRKMPANSFDPYAPDQR